MRDERNYFVGVVEDRNDPLKIGRVRVRVFFVHPEDKTLVPTDHLPWAHVSSNLRPKEGNHVRGFFEDGEDANLPVIDQILIGIPEQENVKELGFNDPRTDEQLKNAPRPPQELKDPEDGTGVQIIETAAAVAGFRLNEPIFSRLIRGEMLEDYATMLSTEIESLSDYPLGLDSALTGIANSILIAAQQQVTLALSNLLRSIPGAAPFVPTIIRDFFTQDYFKKYTLSSQYTFPKSKAAPKYPYNDAQVTESGHIVEYDDTPGAERIHTRHRSGTYEEYYPDGDHAQVVKKDKHTVVSGCDTTIVRGKKQTVVEGSESVTVRGAKYLQVEGTCQIVVIGDCELSIQGHAKRYIKGDYDEVIGGDYTQTIGGNFTQVFKSQNIVTYMSDKIEYFGKDLRQYYKDGEWTLKNETNKAFRFEFVNGYPQTNKPINMSDVRLPSMEPEEGNVNAFMRPEFLIEPTVQTKSINAIEQQYSVTGSLSNFDVANAGFSIAKTIADDGFSVV